YSCTSLTSVAIPNSVTSISESTFGGCTGLTSVNIGNSVTSIGNSAFKGCTGLTNVILPNKLASLGESVWENCPAIERVVCTGTKPVEANSNIFDLAIYDDATLYVPKGMIQTFNKVNPWRFFDKITDEKFSGKEFTYTYGGNTLKYVTIDNKNCKVIGYENAVSGSLEIPSTANNYSVTSIDDVAFRDCTALTSVNIPNSVTSIGNNAFSGCTGLTSVTIGNSVTSIGNYAFAGCTSLTSLIIPNSVTSIGNSAFTYCGSLNSVIIGNSVKTIGDEAFGGCRGLTSLTIPNSVTEIGDFAFILCRGLTSVTIPESVTSIGERAFENCTGLTSVYYGSDEPISGSFNIFSNQTYGKATLYMSEKGIKTGKTIDPWKNFKNIAVFDFSGVDDITTDFDANEPYEVYNLNGVKVGDSLEGLTRGFYIVRQGSAVKKIAVK
ncbi:MAG: leucine-rich repeat domain-containing protein, partial [Muribaculaceae bacterium]|nr:leucine-rich repeat domain-containing protein [Muribaculaceae bacterium]